MPSILRNPSLSGWFYRHRQALVAGPDTMFPLFIQSDSNLNDLRGVQPASCRHSEVLLSIGVTRGRKARRFGMRLTVVAPSSIHHRFPFLAWIPLQKISASARKRTYCLKRLCSVVASTLTLGSTPGRDVRVVRFLSGRHFEVGGLSADDLRGSRVARGSRK